MNRWMMFYLWGLKFNKSSNFPDYRPLVPLNYNSALIAFRIDRKLKNTHEVMPVAKLQFFYPAK
ncbi:hypothetical protein ES705_24505 [subsurface metagenome]